MSERTYICVDCEAEFEEFTAECSECGGTEFRTETDEDTEEVDDLINEVAKLSRPLNPVAPA